MKFICSTFGSSGDVFPMLGLTLELRLRGHEVVFATNQHYEPLARKHGIPFEALGTEDEFAKSISNPDLWHPQRAFRHVFQSLCPVLKRQYEIHADHASTGNAVGITNCFGFGALMAQDKLNLPVITLHCQPAVIWSDKQPPLLPGLFGPRWLKSLCYRIGERFFIDAVVCPFINGWRQELRLPPVRKITRWWHSPYAIVCLFPDWYSTPQEDWPNNLIQTDFPLWNDRNEDGLSAEVEEFLAHGDPPLVFTPGSTNLHGRAFFDSAVEACRSLNRRGVLLTEFPEQIPDRLPDTVVHFRYVPLDVLLPTAAAFVHHGGIGSTSQGLAAGIPQVLMPLAHDQFDNAERIAWLGVGGWIKADRFTGPRVARHLDKLLTSEPVAACCRKLAQVLEPRDGLRRAVAAIEDRVTRA
ncbi:MAG: glycosyltransferase [Planctomycetaceae bacterium]|nr:glycosyltransferase [Planctomycetaceae bacterium]